MNTKHKYPGSRGRYSRDFEELEIIGEGGFGKVYRVKHRLDGGIYAIKKIIINYGNPTERKMLKEVSLLSKLNHPNIVRYYQSWLEDVASLEELVEDMSFADEQDKIDELKSIYRVWRDENNDVFFRDDSAAE